jgi:hypothetical protein
VGSSVDFSKLNTPRQPLPICCHNFLKIPKPGIRMNYFSVISYVSAPNWAPNPTSVCQPQVLCVEGWFLKASNSTSSVHILRWCSHHWTHTGFSKETLVCEFPKLLSLAEESFLLNQLHPKHVTDLFFHCSRQQETLQST